MKAFQQEHTTQWRPKLTILPICNNTGEHQHPSFKHHLVMGHYQWSQAFKHRHAINVVQSRHPLQSFKRTRVSICASVMIVIMDCEFLSRCNITQCSMERINAMSSSRDTKELLIADTHTSYHLAIDFDRGLFNLSLLQVHKSQCPTLPEVGTKELRALCTLPASLSSKLESSSSDTSSLYINDAAKGVKNTCERVAPCRTVVPWPLHFLPRHTAISHYFKGGHQIS